ncbi:hypothetical protein GTO89_02505 [Heliobacterium gestii]|uniref:Uncharacterized protein n=1 Tax=Heliomicrobium gestii TaxID=2699 RepID=A0A845L9H1_HELGE|nr:LamG domain-containing protein [Heliomicrobium gestii]MBM7865654.1 hypothetical protein [Heliomicrobium gestii]MZP41904.1 hypothetical protein [Heliomicrobium gestii]
MVETVKNTIPRFSALGQIGLRFQGKSVVVIPHHDDFNFGVDDFSLDFWFRATPGATNRISSILEKRGADTPYPIAVRYREGEGGGVIVVSRLDDSGINPQAISSVIKDRTLHHIAVVRRTGSDGAAKLLLYLDGKKCDEVTDNTKGKTKNTAPLLVGQDGQGAKDKNEAFTGVIRQLRIWKGTLSLAMILNYMRDGIDGKLTLIDAATKEKAELRGNWLLSEGYGTIAFNRARRCEEENQYPDDGLLGGRGSDETPLWVACSMPQVAFKDNDLGEYREVVE